MSMNVERAYILLSIIEKAGSHLNIRAQALYELAEMEKACVDEVRKRNDAQAEEARKAEALKAEKAQDEAKARAKVEEQARDEKALADEKAKFAEAERKANTPPQVEKAASTEPEATVIERRL